MEEYSCGISRSACLCTLWHTTCDFLPACRGRKVPAALQSDTPECKPRSISSKIGSIAITRVVALKIFKKSIISKECESRRGRESKRKSRGSSWRQQDTQLCSELCGKLCSQDLEPHSDFSAEDPALFLTARGDCTSLEGNYTEARPASARKLSRERLPLSRLSAQRSGRIPHDLTHDVIANILRLEELSC